jgi:2-polyprenyl-3-methyl-5-hydroxy-6-metoxy-1,4-benzoquinol methylase
VVAHHQGGERQEVSSQRPFTSLHDGDQMNATSPYVLGHADLEIERLEFQAGIIAGVSQRLIRECGIGPGMRVLDIGCGVGDVSMLLAEAVGDTGSVVAFDRESRAIEMARARALAAGHRQIEFVVASDEAFPDRPAFDAAIGRYILHHQSDPVAMIRRAAMAVRHGGVVAFHEPAGYISGHSLPAIDLYAKLERYLSSVFRTMLPHRDVGGRLIACFEEAGLPTPHLIWESIAGGYDSPLWRLSAMTYRSMLPHIAASRGLAPADMGDPGTLADRLIAAAAAARAQIVSKPQSCAWAIRP